MWGRTTGTDLGVPFYDIQRGCAGNLGEAHEKTIVASLLWRQINLATQWPGVSWQRHLPSPAECDIFLGPWPRYLRWQQCWAQPCGWGHYLVQFSAAHCHLPRLLKHRAHWGKFLHSFSFLVMCPGHLYYLTVGTPHGDGRLTSSQLAFPLSPGLITLT